MDAKSLRFKYNLLARQRDAAYSKYLSLSRRCDDLLKAMRLSGEDRSDKVLESALDAYEEEFRRAY